MRDRGDCVSVCKVGVEESDLVLRELCVKGRRAVPGGVLDEGSRVGGHLFGGGLLAL